MNVVRTASRILIGLLVLPMACSSNSSSTGTGGSGGSLTGTGGSSTGTGGSSTGTGGSSTGTGGRAGSGGTTSTGSGGSTATGGTGGRGGGGGTTSSGTGGATSGTGGATSGTGGGGGTRGTAGSTGTGGASGVAGSTGARASVLQHHNDLARTGVYVDAAFTKTAAASLAVDTSFANAKVTGNVYAQPLYLAGSGTTPDEVIVATEADNVYAFDASSGAQLWTKSMGTAATTSGDLPCGGIKPTVGITGTPVIDAATRTIYLDAMTVDTTTSTKVVRHMVHALDASTGADRSGWPVDLTGTMFGSLAFDGSLQNQRAALTLVNGQVFVPFSGHIGDCGGYHGWIFGITTSGTPKVTAWASAAVGSGIWGASGMPSDGTSLYFSTGNGKVNAAAGASNTSPATWGDNETVYKFPTTLVSPAASPAKTTDFYVPTNSAANSVTTPSVPSNWPDLDKADADMGGTSPVPIDVTGATPSSLLVALGKDAKAYLLNRANLGGMDAAPIAVQQVTTGTIITAAVSYTTSAGTFIVLKGVAKTCPAGQSGQLTALKIGAANPPTISVAWCGGPTSGAGIPSVTMTDTTGANAMVWVIGSDNKVYAVDASTGTSVATTAALGATVQGIETPIVANGRMFVASNTQVLALKP